MLLTIIHSLFHPELLPKFESQLYYSHPSQRTTFQSWIVWKKTTAIIVIRDYGILHHHPYRTVVWCPSPVIIWYHCLYHLIPIKIRVCWKRRRIDRGIGITTISNNDSKSDIINSDFIFLRLLLLLLLLPRHNSDRNQNKKMNMHTNMDNRNKSATTTVINIPVVVFQWIHARHINMRLFPKEWVE